MSFAAAPVEYVELIERGARETFGDGFDVVGEVDVGVLAGWVLEKLVGGERRSGSSDLLIQRPVTGEDVLAKVNKVGASQGFLHKWLGSELFSINIISQSID